MPRKGEVGVYVTSASVGAAARWLRTTYLPHRRTRGDTVLTPGYNAEAIRDLEQLATQLAKIAVRKRRDGKPFKVNIQRSLVERFASVDAYLLVPSAVSTLLAAFRDAARSKRGRPFLSKSHRAERLSTEFQIDPDHRRRLKRRDRFETAWASWFDEVRARGETVLTTSLPSPKI